MDTRFKIVSLDVALADASPAKSVIATGEFDPLLADHARRLRELRSGYDRLIVMLTDPPDPVLDTQARAQLLAALEVVDFVVLPCSDRLSPLGFRVEHVPAYEVSLPVVRD